MANNFALEKAVSLTRKKQFNKALEIFESHSDLKETPSLSSYYALCLAGAKGKFEEAERICLYALTRWGFNPNIHLNLSKIYILEKKKMAAIERLEKGLIIAPDHKGLKNQLSRLGNRKNPVLTFLPRKHFLNKCLGKIRYKINHSETSLLEAA